MKSSIDLTICITVSNEVNSDVYVTETKVLLGNFPSEQVWERAVKRKEYKLSLVE